MAEIADTVQITLRDQLSNAFDALSEDESIPKSDDRPRDEIGRFKNSDAQPEIETKKEQPSQVLDAVAASEQPTPQIRQRPTSWKKDYEADWSKLDPRLQEYISQRESDYARGVSTYKQNWDQVAPLWDAMQPFLPTLKEHNVSPNEWVSGLGSAHITLVRGTPEQKLQMFAKLANDYGVPLQALVGQQADPQFSMLANELSQLKNQWTQFQTQREQQEQQQVQREVSTFSDGKPHFHAVRETMAGLLQSGVANDLQTAYDKAIRLHDDIWQQVQTEAAQAKAQEAAGIQQQKVAKAKAAAVSPRSVSSTAILNGSGKNDIRSLLSEQLAAASGRV